jgi:hypothetical protein
MKRLFIYALLLSLGTTTYCQEKQLTRDDYLRRSKAQKKTAWIALGSGAALLAFSAIASETTAVFFTVPLGLSALGFSLGSFISADRNKEKADALTAGIKLERLNDLGMMKVKNVVMVGVTVRLNL